MPDPCRILAWDTDFFGFRVARVVGDSLTPETVREIDGWSEAHGIRCLYFLARADDPATTQLAEDHGFHLIDVRMTFRHAGESAPAAGVRLVRPEDVSALEAISRECYHDSRFYYDRNFPRSLCTALYETWIRRSCEGQADAVLVAELDAAPVGYVTCHLERSSIGLVGVSNRTRGGGTGRALVNSALAWFHAHSVREVFVATQGRNHVAQRFYQRCGFLTHAVQLWYHKWYPSRE